MVDWLMNGLVNWLAEKVVDLLGVFLAFLTSSMFLSPDVTALPQVRAIAAKSALVVNACAILAIIAVGLVSMAGDSVRMRYTLKELLPRLVVGLVMSNFAVALCAVLIDVANSLTATMVGTAAPTTEAVTMARTHVAAAMSDPASAVLAAILGLIAVALMLALGVSWIARVGGLVILAGLAPVALACYSLPWTQPVAGLWWRSMLGCLATPALQAIAFSTGVQLLIDPQAGLPVLLGVPGSDTVNLLLVIVLLWTTVKIPSFMKRFVTHQGGVNIGELVMRTVLVQTVTGRLPWVRALRGRR